jgi:hypothetical protein
VQKLSLYFFACQVAVLLLMLHHSNWQVPAYTVGSSWAGECSLRLPCTLRVNATCSAPQNHQDATSTDEARSAPLLTLTLLPSEYMMQSLRSCPGFSTWHRNLEPSSSPAYFVRGLQDNKTQQRQRKHAAGDCSRADTIVPATGCCGTYSCAYRYTAAGELAQAEWPAR